MSFLTGLVIGDQVRCYLPQGSQAGVIEEVLPRRSFLARKVAGMTSAAQPLAANVDYVFIASSLNQDLNWNRFDRYLTMFRLWCSTGSGAHQARFASRLAGATRRM